MYEIICKDYSGNWLVYGSFATRFEAINWAETNLPGQEYWHVAERRALDQIRLPLTAIN